MYICTYISPTWPLEGIPGTISKWVGRGIRCCMRHWSSLPRTHQTYAGSSIPNGRCSGSSGRARNWFDYWQACEDWAVRCSSSWNLMCQSQLYVPWPVVPDYPLYHNQELHRYIHRYIYICTYIHTYVHMYIHMHATAYVCTYMHTSIHAAVYMYVCTYVFVCT